MQDLPARVHRLKLVLVSLLLTISGAALIGFEQSQAPDVDGLIGLVPWNELGGIIVGAGLLSIWVDHLFRREQEAADDERLRAIMKDQAPIMRDAVLEAFAADKADLARVATTDTLDQIITNSLGLRLGDEQFAAEVYSDIRAQAVEAPERWHDADVSIDVTPMSGSKKNADYFDVTVRWEYTTTPAHAQRRFVCLSDRDEYASLAHWRDGTSAWFMTPNKNFAANEREAFALLQFSVDGVERKIRRSTRKDYQAYTVSVGDKDGLPDRPVTISYTYRTVTRKSGHLLFFDIEQPTRDAKMTFDYTGSGIKSVRAIDQIPSIRETRIERSPESVPTKTVRVEIDGWVFPRSGVAFVWVLQNGLH